jgi:hydroxymethylbilane synthase
MRAATRGSALARWQTDHVAALLRGVDPSVVVDAVVIETTADRRLDIPIEAMGGKGVFVKEVQAALLDGRADIAVHSAKDLPAVTPEGLVIAAVPERADPRDVLVGATLTDLPQGAHVATGSARRRVQLAALRPDLRFSGLRGNIATRLSKVGTYDAVLMALAALERLDLHPDIVDVLDAATFVPQVGQGALAIECRADDTATRSLLARIEHAPTRRAVDAERAFLAELGGDCTLPAGAHATIVGDQVHLDGLLASTDERTLHRRAVRGADGESLGRSLARALRDDLGDEPALP